MTDTHPPTHTYTPSPRLVSAHLSHHVQKQIRLLGTILATPNPQTAILESADNGQVTIHRSHDAQSYGSRVVEVIGIVGDDLSVVETEYTEMGEEFGKVILFLSGRGEIKCRVK